MCTAVAYSGRRRLFGRNLDLEGSFGEGVVIVPRNYPFAFRREGTLAHHHAMIGMAVLAEGYPLFFDAINECGLGMAGLNFPKTAVYRAEEAGKKNVSPFELIPYILANCATLAEARALLGEINAVAIPFGERFPLTPLHWMVSDGRESIVVEPMEDGLKIYDDPAHVLTNNPPFPMQLSRLSDYMSLTPDEPAPRFGEGLGMQNYSRGMGTIGLPGDFSSAGRFVRAAFVRDTLVTGEGEMDEVCGFFHILGSVAVPRGCMRLKAGVYEETVYSSCCDLGEGVYYYTTYSNPAVHAVRLDKIDSEGTMPAMYPLKKDFEVFSDD